MLGCPGTSAARVLIGGRQPQSGEVGEESTASSSKPEDDNSLSPVKTSDDIVLRSWCSLASHSERREKTRQTEEEVGRQHQGKDRPRVRKVPEGSGEQRKMEETGCEVTCGAPTTPVVMG